MSDPADIAMPAAAGDLPLSGFRLGLGRAVTIALGLVIGMLVGLVVGVSTGLIPFVC